MLLTDSHNRSHNYLRISLTERCNLRCTYCMPEAGVPLSPKSHLMTADELFSIASIFVANGVNKIRLTGGEPLIRKDFREIITQLASLPVEIGITTNGIIVDQFIDCFKQNNVKLINISLDTLNTSKFKEITRRDYFDKVYQNLLLLVAEGFIVKLNAVLIKGFNDKEINDFIRLTKEMPIVVRFIEFMPFDGNKWDMSKMLSYAELMDIVKQDFNEDEIMRIEDAPNDTSKNYKIKTYQGSFAIISSVSNPFCDTCNRLRLTANGRLKNCLFSSGESDLLSSYRKGEAIEPIIAKTILNKQKVRGGMDTLEKLNKPELHSNNRSMITIGG